MLKSLTPNMMVHDVNATIDWYQSVLGFAVVARVPEEGQLDFAIMHRDGVQLMFQSASSLGGDLPELRGAAIGASQTFYVEVENVNDLRDQVEGNAKVLKELHDTFYGTREFYFADCNGYIFGLSQELAQD